MSQYHRRVSWLASLGMLLSVFGASLSTSPVAFAQQQVKVPLERVTRVETAAGLSVAANFPHTIKTGDACELLGRTTAGDDGGQTLIYHLTGRSGVTADGGFYFNGFRSDDYWEAADKSVVSVKKFGAIGDGTADDTTAITNAITAATSGNHKILFFPPGKYKYTDNLVFSNLRNIIIQGSGGNNNSSQIGTSLEFTGNNADPDHVSGPIKFLSCNHISIQGICFINRTDNLDYHIFISANNTPDLSSHLIEFDNCGFYAGGGIDVAVAGIQVANSKFVKFHECFFDHRGSTPEIRFGLNIADSPSTLMTGTAAMCSVEDCIIFNDIDIRNINGLAIRNCGFDARTIATGASCITVSGTERASGVEIANNDFTEADAGAAITTGDYAGSTTLAPSAGWKIYGNTFRDRAVGIQVDGGGVSIDANIFQVRRVGDKGIVIASSAPAQGVEITQSNDFRVAVANGEVSIEDNRASVVGLSYDSTGRPKSGGRYFSTVIAQSSVAASHTGNTNETTLATVTVPAGAMGANGRVRITSLWSYTNSANTKTLRIRFGGTGGTVYLGINHTATVSYMDRREIANVNATNSQKGPASGSSGGSGSTTGAVVTSAVDTTAAVDIVFRALLTDSGETITLESYCVELLYGG